MGTLVLGGQPLIIGGRSICLQNNLMLADKDYLYWSGDQYDINDGIMVYLSIAPDATFTTSWEIGNIYGFYTILDQVNNTVLVYPHQTNTSGDPNIDTLIISATGHNDVYVYCEQAGDGTISTTVL